MARRDQRLRGEQYVRGLLSVEGRKSMSNIAEKFGGGAVQQSLQHFISSSSWDWLPIRRALARYLEYAMVHRAWVVKQMVVTKSGTSSVGVERHFVPELGQTVNSQQAFGVWLASESASVPVNWGLFLPPAWLSDGARRRKAGIPSGGAESTLGGCACRAVLAVTEDWQTRHFPVVLDVDSLEVADCIRRFAAAQVPVVLRVCDNAWLSMDGQGGPQLPGHNELTSLQIAGSLLAMRRPVSWVDPDSGAVRRSLVATAPVRLARVLEPQPPLLLFAEWAKAGPRPTRLWLTNITQASPPALLGMTKLSLRVEHDFAKVSEQVGIRDFEGRSFQGWHRHMTLASVAHAALILSEFDSAAAEHAPQSEELYRAA
ncbi:IS701 family transposase [Kitasatospora sp. NPDC006697]|uniref:IS701 family transposase n=1 Tax=Kitasatospora sp. NPDC006697 TaxID=3364020 RepID=UPI0036BD86F7